MAELLSFPLAAFGWSLVLLDERERGRGRDETVIFSRSSEATSWV